MLQVEIRIKGQIAEHWSAWFEGLELTHTEAGDTLLCGELPDQAALFGVLARLRDLGLPLKSVLSEKSLGPEPAPPPAQQT